MEYYKIGKFVATHGWKGDLLLKHALGKKTSLKGLTTLFTEQNKSAFLPWFIESTKIRTEDEIFIKLEGINSREDAIKLTQKEVWLPEVDFKKYAARTSTASMLGYMIVEDKKELGEILEIIEQPHQILCRIEINKKEVLIPLNESTLQQINHRKKLVTVTLPEGLLEIYLG